MSTVSLPADRVVHLHVDNLTSNWSTYMVDFDAAKPGPMTLVITMNKHKGNSELGGGNNVGKESSDLHGAIPVIKAEIYEDDYIVKQDELGDINPRELLGSGSRQAKAFPARILNCRYRPGCNVLNPPVHTYRVTRLDDEVTRLDDEVQIDAKENIRPSKRHRC